MFSLHMKADGHQEEQRDKNNEKLGTTKKGIGPAYASKVYRTGIRVADLIADDFEAKFAQKFRRLANDHVKSFGIEVDVEKEIELYKDYARELKPYVCETVSFLHKALVSNQKILVEGANASMLDIDFGTYPYVTSSNCSIGGVCTGLGKPRKNNIVTVTSCILKSWSFSGIPPPRIGSVFGVVKAYTTRVGAGAFPTELRNDLGDYLQKTGAEFGVTTGRKRRCGWLDIPMLKWAKCFQKSEYFSRNAFAGSLIP